MQGSLVAAVARPARTTCLHCDSSLAGASGDFCCAGCETVHALLTDRGLGRYYDLRGEAGVPRPGAASAHDHKWLEPLAARVSACEASTRLDVDVQGVHCAACVWLLGELFRRRADGVDILVNPGVGTATLLVRRGFDLDGWASDVESFGYVLGPPLKEAPRASGRLLARIGVCAALALNTMIFSLPLYLGLDRGPIHTLFRTLAFALSAATIAVGGSVFLQSAWNAARRRVLHLDMPIALGIVSAFAGSTVAFFSGRDGGTYLDTIAVFVTLMLVGRWLQEHVLEKNRRWLLASDGAQGLMTRRVRGRAVELVRCTEIRSDDTLLIAPGDVVPVEGVLVDDTASCSLDWISGESVPREFRRDDVVPAGAFNGGRRAIEVRAAEGFERSALLALLRVAPTGEDGARATSWWRRLAGTWVVAVVALAAGGFLAWLFATHDARRALDVATAILVVTCPCAFGIATPMAYELVQARLRRAGLFVRSPSFLDRASSVRRVVFDKTGTLTTGTLRLTTPAVLETLAPGERDALYNLAARSTHPKSVAIRRALEPLRPHFVPGLDVAELPGSGLELREDGHVLRLGAAAFAAPDAADASDDLVFAADGAVLATLATTETLRPDARAEIAALTADGYAVHVLSGDTAERVAAIAGELGLGPADVTAAQSPSDKARWLGVHDRDDTLMVGDGINDALAVEQAYCSGTPSIDRPFMPARTDFYLVAAGLGPIRLALHASRALVCVHRRNLCVATAYNVVAVGLALSGLMSPLLCAVLMPASSLGILLATVASLSGRSAEWQSSFSRSS